MAREKARTELSAAFLALRLRRDERWERDATGRVVLVVPRFRRGRLARWVQPRLRGPRRHLRVRLDAIGTFVWERANGLRRVEEILTDLRASFVDEPDLGERLRRFVDELLREDFFATGAGPAVAAHEE